MTEPDMDMDDECCPDLNWGAVRDITLVGTFVGALVWYGLQFVPQTAEQWIPVGEVQDVRYFGALGFYTQIDTRYQPPAGAQALERSLVVRGFTQFRKGQTLVMQVEESGRQLCSVDRTHCETLRGGFL